VENLLDVRLPDVVAACTGVGTQFDVDLASQVVVVKTKYPGN
jgi:hypothetical protein